MELTSTSSLYQSFKSSISPINQSQSSIHIQSQKTSYPKAERDKYTCNYVLTHYKFNINATRTEVFNELLIKLDKVFKNQSELEYIKTSILNIVKFYTQLNFAPLHDLVKIEDEIQQLLDTVDKNHNPKIDGLYGILRSMVYLHANTSSFIYKPITRGFAQASYLIALRLSDNENNDNLSSSVSKTSLNDILETMLSQKCKLANTSQWLKYFTVYKPSADLGKIHFVKKYNKTFYNHSVISAPSIPLGIIKWLPKSLTTIAKNVEKKLNAVEIDDDILGGSTCIGITVSALIDKVQLAEINWRDERNKLAYNTSLEIQKILLGQKSQLDVNLQQLTNQNEKFKNLNLCESIICALLEFDIKSISQLFSGITTGDRIKNSLIALMLARGPTAKARQFTWK